MIQVALFDSQGRAQFGGPELLQVERSEGTSIWIDIEGRSSQYEQFLLEQGFHPLAVEDTFTLQHHPKLQEYDGYLFLIVRGIDMGRQRQRLETLKLAAFLDRRRLVTCHRAPMRSVAAIRQKIQESGHLPKGGTTHLLYLICDEMVDHYFPVLDEIGREIEALEESIFAEPTQEHLEQILEIRRRLSTLRRVMLPHRQIFNHLAAAKTPYIDEQETLYFRDVYDNVFRLADALDHQRDQLTSAKDTYLSVVSQRTNEVMKVLTLFSATLLPLSCIAGIYGMNFEYMPELELRYGYFGILGFMGLVAGSLLAWFWRKGWL